MQVLLYVIIALVAVTVVALGCVVVAARRRGQRVARGATDVESGAMVQEPGHPRASRRSGATPVTVERDESDARRWRLRATVGEEPAQGAETPRGMSGPAKVDVPLENLGIETPRVGRKPASLTVEAGPLSGQRLPISDAGLNIGRSSDNDVVLAGEPMISRRHAVIVAEQGRHVLYDRDSANGTWVNDERVFRHVLTHGDRIQIGQSVFVYTTADRPAPVPGTAVTPVEAPTVLGKEFDGYILEHLIGRGGMSEVYRATDQSGQTVALKILQVWEPYVVAKFMQEGNKIGPLLRLPSGEPHPNIAAAYKFDRSSDGRLYIVMECVESPSLRSLIGKQLSDADIVEVMGQVCSALQLAHEHNIVHRDIKPENILVSRERVVKVLDFGIAKLTSAATVTRDKIVGTPEYLSPEQAKGEPVCPASDVYALGIVLYELMTGSVPFRLAQNQDLATAALEVVRQHLRERPEPPRRRNPDGLFSRKLEKVAMRALEKSVSKRYACAGEMGEALGYSQPAVIGAAAPQRPPVEPKPAHLVIIQGPRRGHSIPLVGQTTTIGRACLEPSNVTISRQHACIVFRGGDYWLQDTSSNGTWVDNQRVYGEIPLRTGARITIGETVLRLTLD